MCACEILPDKPSFWARLAPIPPRGLAILTSRDRIRRRRGSFWPYRHRFCHAETQFHHAETGSGDPESRSVHPETLACDTEGQSGDAETPFRRPETQSRKAEPAFREGNALCYVRLHD